MSLYTTGIANKCMYVEGEVKFLYGHVAVWLSCNLIKASRSFHAKHKEVEVNLQLELERSTLVAE